jgi:hypothetical protein
MAEASMLALEFDELRRILHVSAREIVHIRTQAQVRTHFSSVMAMLDGYTQSGRVYLIIDMSNVIIDPELTGIYARYAREVGDKYIFPNGIARYGYQITRVTVRRGYEEYLAESPNLFNSRDEADTYISGLIEKQSAIPADDAKPATAAHS